MTKQTKVEKIDLAQEFFLLPPKYRTMNNLRELYRNAIEQDLKQAREEERKRVLEKVERYAWVRSNGERYLLLDSPEFKALQQEGRDKGRGE